MDAEPNDGFDLNPALPRQPGALRGMIWIAPDFDETPKEILEAMEVDGAGILDVPT